MTEWRFSLKRLSELDAELADLGERIDSLPFEDRRKTATRELAEDLGRTYARLSDERDRCAMAIWRRNRRRTS